MLLLIGLLAAQAADLPWANGEILGETLHSLLPAPPQSPRVVLISGHAGNDTGAICSDVSDDIVLTEAEINAAVAKQAADILRRAGNNVEIFTEFDQRLDGLQADVMVSLHADSCVDFSGYKTAHREENPSPADTRLSACVNQFYAEATGLSYHPDTITHDMIDYHAFRQIAASTPGLILEMGFMGGDQALLTDSSDLVAKGVADGIECFLAEPFGGKETPNP